MKSAELFRWAHLEKEEVPKKIKHFEETKKPIRNEMMDRDDSVLVLIREAAITRADQQSRFLKTYGLGPCIGVSLYDPDSKVGALAHLDPELNAVDAIDFIIERMQTIGANPRDARMVGGSLGSEILVFRIELALKIHGIKIKESDVLEGIEPKRIILDTNTGELFDLFPRGKYFDSSDEIRQRLDSVLTRPNLVFTNDSL